MIVQDKNIDGYKEAIKEIQRINDDLFYDDFKSKIIDMSDLVERKSQETVQDLKKLNGDLLRKTRQTLLAADKQYEEIKELFEKQDAQINQVVDDQHNELEKLAQNLERNHHFMQEIEQNFGKLLDETKNNFIDISKDLKRNLELKEENIMSKLAEYTQQAVIEHDVQSSKLIEAFNVGVTEHKEAWHEAQKMQKKNFNISITLLVVVIVILIVQFFV